MVAFQILTKSLKEDLFYRAVPPSLCDSLEYSILLVPRWEHLSRFAFMNCTPVMTFFVHTLIVYEDLPV